MNISEQLAIEGWLHLQNVDGISGLRSLLPHHNTSAIKTIKFQGRGTVEHSNILVPPHTDVFWRLVPPRYLLLFCERPAPVGGESLLIGNVSRCVSSDILATLKKENVTHYKNGHRLTYRIYDNDIIRIPHNYRSIEQAPPSHFLDAWLALVEELKKNVLKIRLEAGDGLIIDNHTSLHGRLAFRNTIKQARVLHKVLIND
ncbi:TauD/TfdA family dioxygenase [Vibrio alginolyticus]|uniref:TauD/TfdA family dioxygenase n=1 Tax=Vibrio alginolyticus TaxID=663 RepID=UPI0037527B45